MIDESMDKKIETIKENVDKIFEQSINIYESDLICMVLKNGKEYLYVLGDGELFNSLNGELLYKKHKICDLNTGNRLTLNKYFEFTRPRPFGTEVTTIGLGDRLGLASEGHINAVSNYNIRPILAQQSIRELNLTHRTFPEVIDSAAFAIFKMGYKLGYGADGDHLKLEEDIQYALDSGVSMITLDCSDYINNDANNYTEEKLQEEYKKVNPTTRQEYEKLYLNKNFEINGLTISFKLKDLMYNVVQYRKAIEYMIHIYEEYIMKNDQMIDFEISIDETVSITSPRSHFFVAHELIKKGVHFTSMAPRFIGEFQKGIDYIGDLEIFEENYAQHVLIAEHFNYKISIHSGSDKFSIFPIIADKTNSTFHIKTAGTNWLEALRVIAEYEPIFFRELFEYAFKNFERARNYYHITPDIDLITDPNLIKDKDLKKYLEDDNARQLLHVTYGLLLTDKIDNEYKFRINFFEKLRNYQEKYTDTIEKHISHHLEKLNVKATT